MARRVEVGQELGGSWGVVERVVRAGRDCQTFLYSDHLS